MPFDDVGGTLDDGMSQSVLLTNLLGPIRMTSALIGHLKAQPNAAIINTTSVLAFVPLAGNAVYSAAKAALHSYTLSLRFMLRDTNVAVREIAPPWVNTDLVKRSDDPRAMPLPDFIAETMEGLEQSAAEVVVERARAFRANPGPDEHALVQAFNLSVFENPIPV